jgi:hypothetical protein
MAFIGTMPKRFVILVALGLLFLTFTNGCIMMNQCGPYNAPSEEKLRVQSSKPEEYTVQVDGKNTFNIAADGRVVIDVPRLSRTGTLYVLLIPVSKSNPYKERSIYLEKNNRIKRKLSLNDIGRLPVDQDGYHLLKVK